MENTSESLKSLVKEKYGKIAENSGCCCRCSCGDAGLDFTVMSESYDSQEGYCEDADLSLGCGLPTEFADIKPGDHVLDLGSGAGNDCFVARALVGETGKVTGLDFTDGMLQKAELNNLKLGYKNVGFIKGDIENIPLTEGCQNVIISNCVLNLVPDKQKAFSEIFRVLKAGGHFCVSDIVLKGTLPEALQHDAEMYAGCVSGAVQKEEYLEIIRLAGFNNIEIKKEKEILLPDDILAKYLNDSDLKQFKNSKTGIFSITVTGRK